MKKLIFSQQAAFTMMNESLRVGEGFETGGALIGSIKHKGFVKDVIVSSPHAERQATTYFQSEDDVEIMNRQLRQAQERGLDFIGYWHRHPSGMTYLSQGDMETSRGILSNPSYKIDNELLMIIVTGTNDPTELPMFAYLASLTENSKVLVRGLEVEVLPDMFIGEFANYSKQASVEGENNEEDNDTRHCPEGDRELEDGGDEEGADSAPRDSTGRSVDHRLHGYEERT